MKVLLILACAVAIVICKSVDTSVNEYVNPKQKRDIILIKTGKDVALSEEEDAIDTMYGKQIARKLQRITDSEQRLLCEYLIETAIHRATMRKLKRVTQILDSDNQQGCPDSRNVPPPNDRERAVVSQSQGPLQTSQAKPDLPFTAFYKRSVDVPPTELKQIAEIHSACQNNPHTFAQDGRLRTLSNNKENKQVQVHMFCMAEKYGLVQYDGQFNEEVIKRKIAFVIKNNDDLNDIYRKCSVLKRTKEETITHFWLCLVAQGQEFYEQDL